MKLKEQIEIMTQYLNGGEVECVERGCYNWEIANSPWWNNTYCMLVRCENFVFNYGEIIPSQYVNVGDMVEEGDVLGWVVPVLKKNKGRPKRRNVGFFTARKG